MRTLILRSLMAIIVFCLCTNYSFAQMNSRESLLKKSRKQRTAAWVLLGAGSALTLTGVILETHKVESELLSIFDSGIKNNSDAGEVLLISGLVFMAGSTPFFIASHKNSDKAIYMKAAINKITIPIKGLKVLYTQAAITLTVPIDSK